MFSFHACKCIAFTTLYSNFVHLSSLLRLFLLASLVLKTRLKANRPENFRDESDSLLTFSADPIYFFSNTDCFCRNP
jgi:hypothetical protein